MATTPDRSSAPEDIAIIGVACLFPGAPDVGAFWRNIVGKVSSITGPPPEAWDESALYEPGSHENDRVYCRKGGYLGPLAYFDPLEHGIMPRAVEGGEPDQWLALHVARLALRDAGYGDSSQLRRTALILGKGNYANRGTISVVYHGVVVDYTLQLLKSIHPELTEEDLGRIRADLKRRLPRFDAETAPALISNVAVGRIANRLDLMGPSYTVDAACASSLVAVDAAVKGLRHREYDLALVGGMQVATPSPVLSLFCQLNALSASEEIHPFGKDADGTLLSEGVGMAVLKRRSDAERDGDRIYAFVKATGVASDGRAVSVLAPRVEGEELALRHAYDDSGIAPDTVGLIEAHGTATLVGDATEIEALGRVFGERRGLPRCAVGSVKSMIGHMMPAAGIAGMIKAALSLYHKVLPPTLGVSEPSPRLKLEQTPFYINTETRPWIHGQRESPRRAGVNAFGFGGINAHVVLEEAPAQADYRAHESGWETEVCLLAGRRRADVIDLAGQVLAALRQNPELPLADVSFSLNSQFEQAGSRAVVVGVVAATTDDLARKLERASTRLSDPGCRKIKEVGGIYFFEEPLSVQGRVAFLFPGEGAQYVNMLADLCRYFPEVRACFDEMDRHFAGDARGHVLSDVLFPPPAFSEAEQARAEQRLWDMDAAVEAVFTANHALHTLLTAFGIRPDAILGHSTGEHSAMRAAGMLDQDAYDARVREISTTYRGAAADGRVPVDARLIAVGASRDRVAAACAPLGAAVCVAMDNCRHQVVVMAPLALAGQAEALFKAEGFLYEILSFDRPYHTPLFADFAAGVRAFTESLIVRPPAVPLYSATSTRLFPGDVAGIHKLAYEHWLQPVEFRQTIERMHDDGIRVFIEAGPRGNLTAFVDDILAGRSYAAIPANVTRRSGVTQLNHLLAQLAAHGVPFDVRPLYAHRRPAVVDFAAPAGTGPAKGVLGRVKIPTGAPALGLSPEMIELVRARSQQRRPTEWRAPTPPAVAAPAQTAAVPTPAPEVVSTAADAALASSVSRPAASATPTFAAGSTTSSGPSLDDAAQVMSAYLATMGQFLAMQQELLGSGPDHGPGPGTAQAQRLPLLQTVLERSDHVLVARCTLDAASCPLLLDHTLGRNVSTEDADLPAFAIVPFTLMTELMAQAAAALLPGLVLTEMRGVRAHRWVAIDRGPAVLEVRAERMGPAEQVAVRLALVEDDTVSPVAEGVMVLGAGYAEPPWVAAASLADGRPYRWGSEQLYEEAMFHGPAFRGVLSIDSVSPAGALASLAVLDRSRLVTGAGCGDFITDVVLLDLPGQVVGFWASQFVPEGFVILPFQMESLRLYGGMLDAGERLTCVAQISMPDADRIRAALDVIRPDGRLWARFEGWEDRRFDVPTAAVQLLLKPEAGALSQPWHPPVVAAGTHGFVARRVGLDELPAGWLDGHGGLWSRVLAATVLSRRERQHWLTLTKSSVRRNEWLLGRIAAKDAIREYVQRHFGLILTPADVEVLPDAHGRPAAQGSWLGQVPTPPLVSISHVHGTAVALAGDGDRLSGLGIDLERVGRMQPATERVAFTANDLRLLDDLVDAQEREAWSLRLWCAKEACAKATGRGLTPGLHAYSICGMDRADGTVLIRYQAPDLPPLDLFALTSQHGDWITATCAPAGERIRT